ncbi:MAG: LysR family transcriptional regulator [Phycisphaerae bacterium]|nr:LysR family transcriptional regulator [Phycisphaerae bacterium]
MTTTWVICGACRGVGKTYLAQRLCDLLPGAVYAKHGCGEPQAGKPTNYFRTRSEVESFLKRCGNEHEHIVLECNHAARRGQGDIIIFVDSAPHSKDIRSDRNVLRERAHVRVGPGATIRSWRKVLRAKLADRMLREAVCDLLVEQKRFLTKPGPAVRTKVWFVVGEEHAFGVGLARLLENVDRLGTLREAAKVGHVSYRHAWNLIKGAEKHLGKQLLVAQPGGAGGGKSSLSREGRRLLDTFKRVNAEVAAFADKCVTTPLGRGDPPE